MKLKTIIGIGLAASLLCCSAHAQDLDWSDHMWTPKEVPQAEIGPALVLCVGLTIVVGAMIIIHACEPKVHCVGDGETNWCTFASRRTLLSDPSLHVSSTNYASMKMCQKCCGLSDRTGTMPIVDNDPVYKVTVLASSDAGQSWGMVGSDVGTLSNWQVVDSEAPAQAGIYCAYAEPYSE